MRTTSTSHRTPYLTLRRGTLLGLVVLATWAPQTGYAQKHVDDDHGISGGDRSYEPTTVAAVQNCAPDPRSCGFPDKSNTGVQRGVQLRRVPEDIRRGKGWHYDRRGWVVIDGPSAVLKNVKTKTISVEASDATIQNTRITDTGDDSFGIAIRHAKNTTIAHIEILPPRGRLEVGIKDLYGDARGTRVLRSEIVRTATGISLSTGVIKNNYIHDLAFKPGDHINGTTSNGSTLPLRIRHNTIFSRFDQTDAVSLFQDFGLEGNRLIDNNLLAGGGYTIYAGAGDRGRTYNIRVTNNRISRIYFRHGGYWGPAAYYDRNGTGNEWSGNVWDGGGRRIAAP